MKYSYLLFDADDTLFDFPRASARAFSIMCSLHNIPDTPDVSSASTIRSIWSCGLPLTGEKSPKNL